MATVPCPSCGHPVEVSDKKTGLWWGLGCLIAVPAVLVVVAIFGLLAAIAVPSFVKAKQTSEMNACMNNLRQIDAAKGQWAVMNNVGVDQPFDSEAVNALIKGGTTPRCLAEGTYSYNPIGQDPECSVHGDISNPRPVR